MLDTQLESKIDFAKLIQNCDFALENGGWWLTVALI